MFDTALKRNNFFDKSNLYLSSNKRKFGGLPKTKAIKMASMQQKMYTLLTGKEDAFLINYIRYMDCKKLHHLLLKQTNHSTSTPKFDERGK